VELQADGGAAAVAPGIRVEREEDVLVVALEGEHDLASRDSVRGAVDGALEARLGVVVDLRDAAFIDSVVAAVFLEARKKAKREDIGLAIVLSDSPENAVRRMFELSQLTSVFATYPSTEEAVRGVSGGFSEP
jgi:anti-anti-sigma factor